MHFQFSSATPPCFMPSTSRRTRCAPPIHALKLNAHFFGYVQHPYYCLNVFRSCLWGGARQSVDSFLMSPCITNSSLGRSTLAQRITQLPGYAYLTRSSLPTSCGFCTPIFAVPPPCGQIWCSRYFCGTRRRLTHILCAHASPCRARCVTCVNAVLA